MKNLDVVHIMRTPHIHNALIDDIRYGTFISTCTYCTFLLQYYETYYSPKTPLQDIMLTIQL